MIPGATRYQKSGCCIQREARHSGPLSYVRNRRNDRERRCSQHSFSYAARRLQTRSRKIQPGCRPDGCCPGSGAACGLDPQSRRETRRDRQVRPDLSRNPDRAGASEQRPKLKRAGARFAPAECALSGAVGNMSAKWGSGLPFRRTSGQTAPPGHPKDETVPENSAAQCLRLPGISRMYAGTLSAKAPNRSINVNRDTTIDKKSYLFRPSGLSRYCKRLGQRSARRDRLHRVVPVAAGEGRQGVEVGAHVLHHR